jgi:hypothetical protein
VADVPNAEKIKKVEELNGVFLKAKAAVLADYQGIEAPDLTLLRSHMRSRSVDFRVIKIPWLGKPRKIPLLRCWMRILRVLCLWWLVLRMR